MKNRLNLIKGEIARLGKYQIISIGLLTSFIWIVIFALIKQEEALELAPVFLFADLAIMSILLMGASFYLEKQEGTLSSIMMLPVNVVDIIVAKTIASIFMALLSAIAVAIGLYVIYGIILNYALLLFYVVLTVTASVAIGFVLSLFAHDFSSLLGLLMTYMFIFMIAPLLYSLNIIPSNLEWMLYISPSYGVMHLMTAVINSLTIDLKTILIILYQIIIAVVLFIMIVYPRFKQNAIRG
ncbi:MAG: ABC transporter permease [Erysipelotrichaceae bacterium]|nr:ABC transporter permease [Erysipelotrichaceae bacterium]